MESSRGNLPNFETINLTEIWDKLDECNQQQKFVFMADMSGKVATACSYSDNGSLFDFHAEAKKCIIQKTQTKEEVQERLRK